MNGTHHTPRFLSRRTMLAAFGSMVAISCAGPRSATNPPTAKEHTTGRKILIAVTSHDRKGETGASTGAYLPEIAHPYAVFVRAGFEVELASTLGGRVPLDGVDPSDPVSAAFLADPESAALVERSQLASAVDPARYAAIFFAGGHGAMWDLPDARTFQRAAVSIYEAGGVVGAVCHGPAALVNVRLSNGAYLVAGKRVSAFTDAEERAVKMERVVPFLLESRLVERGALFEAAPLWQPKVVVSERLVTGQNPASATVVAEAIVERIAAMRLTTY